MLQNLRCRTIPQPMMKRVTRTIRPVLQTKDCLITPATYKIVFYKVGVCTADPDLNDLSSCEMFFEDAAGITVDIKAGVSSSFDIPEFTITPGTYPFLYVQLSNKLGMKWQGSMSNNVTGSSGAGKYCWTNNAGFHSIAASIRSNRRY